MNSTAALALALCVMAGGNGLDELDKRVKALCQRYIEGFGSQSTHLCYHHRLSGPKGVAALSPPSDVARRIVRGKPMPYGYGSGIQDVPLENGHFLFALCEAHEATGDAYLARTAREIFSGLKLVATVSPEPGFVPRGPHPDGKSYYPNSSRDQHCAFVEAMWRFGRSPLATAEDKAFIADALDKVARRMERNDWVIKVEDGSHMAHVGWGWKQRTSIGAISLLGVLAAAKDATGRAHWQELYGTFGREADAARWKLLDPSIVPEWRPFTLYSNQFMPSVVLLWRTETDPSRSEQLRRLAAAVAVRALECDVFDVRCWRRLDWAGRLSDAETQQRLDPFGLSLTRPATVLDLLGKFDPAFMGSGEWRRVSLNGKLLFGIPTVALHKALLSEDADLVTRVEPHVRRMVDLMLEHGDRYQHGENFNRAVVLGLHLLARKARGNP